MYKTEENVSLSSKVHHTLQEACKLRSRLDPSSEEFKMLEKLSGLVCEVYDTLDKTIESIDPGYDDSDCFI